MRSDRCLVWWVCLAMGCSTSPPSGATGGDTAVGPSGTGAATGATGGVAKGSPRGVLLIDVDAEGLTAGAVTSPGELCPNQWSWVGTYQGATQCMSPGSTQTVSLYERPDGYTVDSVPAEEICPPGWDFHGTSFGLAQCSKDGDGVVVTATPCPDDTQELGFLFNPQGFCHRSGEGVWYYVWNGPNGDGAATAGSLAKLCHTEFSAMGIGCHRDGPGAVVALSQGLDGTVAYNNASARTLCPSGTTFLGTQNNFSWALCLYEDSVSQVAVTEDDNGRSLATGASPQDMCPEAFLPIGLAGEAVVCVQGG